MKTNPLKTNLLKTNRLPALLLVLIVFGLLCNLSCIKTGLRGFEKNLLNDVEKFNRDYGSKGVTIKNRKIEWTEGFVCSDLILKNSLIKNVELQMVDIRNLYVENSIIENVSISVKSNLSGSVFKNVKFKNFKSVNNYDMPSKLRDSIFIDCEFINCEYAYVTIGKEYRNCKFNKIKEENVSYYDTVVTDSIFTNCKINSIYYDARFENVIFKNSTIIESGFHLKEGENIQFIKCFTDFSVTGKVEDILIQNSKPDEQAQMLFRGDMKNIVVKDCFRPHATVFEFNEGTFSNISIINCKAPVVRFFKANLRNLLIIDSIVQQLTFAKSDVSGYNKMENSEIRGNLYRDSKIRDLAITNCRFKFYVDILFSELTRLKLNNNIYESQTSEHRRYPGEVRHAVKGEKYIDSDKFPLKATHFPENSPYLREYNKKAK